MTVTRQFQTLLLGLMRRNTGLASRRIEDIMLSFNAGIPEPDFLERGWIRALRARLDLEGAEQVVKLVDIRNRDEKTEAG